MMATREEIVTWLDDLEHVIDKSIDAMGRSGDRIEVLEAALRQIASPVGCIRMSDAREIARAALGKAVQW
jgi:hypothetical protein